MSYDVNADDIRALFQSAFDAATNDTDISIESQYSLDIGVYDAGDHAVEWVVYYYTKDVKNLIRTRLKFRELVLSLSREKSIDLATPVTYFKVNA